MRNLPWAFLIVAATAGCCGTVCKPVVCNAIPVRRLPDEVLHSSTACLPGYETVVQANKLAPAAGNPKEVRNTKFETTEAPPSEPVSNFGFGPSFEFHPRAVFYTGGKLGSGAYPLTPDLRVTEAIAVAHGPLHPRLCGRVTVLRRLPGGQQVPIRVDLNEALRDPRENIPVWPGDMILK
jgi:hypothetical protein